MVQRKIKILIVTHSFPTEYYPIGGIFIFNQLKELKKYCDIKVLFPHAYVPKIRFFNPYYRFSKIKNEEFIDGIHILHPKYFMFPRILFLPKILNILLFFESFFSYQFSKKAVDKIMRGWDPNIIHLHGPLGEGLIGIRIKKIYKKPLLITAHGEDITKYLKKMLSRILVKYSLKNSDAIICQSKFLENEIKKAGLKNKKFFVIPMGALTAKFKPKNKDKSREMLGLPKDRKIILFVGHLATRKGVEYLIKAVKLVLQKDKNILCCIIGSGYLEHSLKRLASELGVDSYIKFLGQKKHDEVAPYINACDILVLPSLNEGLPVILCEALACGKPVVATRVAGTPELVTKDVGYLAKPKDEDDLSQKITMALNKKWKKEKLLERAKKFSVSSSAKKLFDVYKSLLKK